MNYCVVTNSRGRAASLVERSLRHSLAQQPAPAKVLFIDQNNPQLKLDPELTSHPLLERLNITAPSVSSARNAFPLPPTTWLVFCDDDGYLATDYAARLAEAIAQQPDCEIFAGSIRRDDNGDFYTPRHRWGGDLALFRNAKLLMGSNFVVRTETFRRLGGFDEKFGAGAYWGSGEETDFAWKAHFSRIPMVYRPELVVHHVRPYAGSLADSCRKGFRYGVGKGALVSKWLLERRRLVVLLEMVEMLFIPIAQIFADFFRGRWRNLPVYPCVLTGRMLGFLRRMAGEGR